MFSSWLKALACWLGAVLSAFAVHESPTGHGTTTALEFIFTLLMLTLFGTGIVYLVIGALENGE